MLIRVADYIAELLKEHGINTVFTVVGGGAMHLNDAFGKREDFTIIHNIMNRHVLWVRKVSQKKMEKWQLYV